MLRPQGLFLDLQSALIERLGLGVSSLVAIERRQVVEALAHIRVLRPQGLFRDRQRALVERLGFSLPNQPDQKRTTAYRESSELNLWSDAHRITIIGNWEERLGNPGLTSLNVVSLERAAKTRAQMVR